MNSLANAFMFLSQLMEIILHVENSYGNIRAQGAAALGNSLLDLTTLEYLDVVQQWHW